MTYDPLDDLVVEEPPLTKKPTKERSALLPDELTEFEKAAMERDDIDLSPPYDPDKENARTVERSKRRHRGKGDRSDEQEDFEVALRAAGRYQTRVFKSHLKWARKVAKKRGIPLERIDLWRLLS